VVREPLQQNLYKVKALHERDLATGTGGVALPHAIERTYPNANREWGWQWVFPPSSHYIDRETGIRRRHHLHESVIQRAMKDAVRKAGVAKPARLP
jgi:hypothetical protein